MSRSKQWKALSLLQNPPLLKSESAEEFNAFRRAVQNEIKPNGAIEKIYAGEFAKLHWEVQRMRRCKATIINIKLRPALKKLLLQLVGENSGLFDDIAGNLEEVSALYFTNQEAKTKVLALFAQFELTDAAIEAQALRKEIFRLDLIEKTLASLEARRDRALDCLANYRETLSIKVQKGEDRMLASKNLLRLEDQSENKAAVA